MIACTDGKIYDVLLPHQRIGFPWVCKLNVCGITEGGDGSCDEEDGDGSYFGCVFSVHEIKVDKLSEWSDFIVIRCTINIQSLFFMKIKYSSCV